MLPHNSICVTWQWYDFITCVKRHARPLSGIVTLATSCRIAGYSLRLSTFDPTRLPNGKSDTITSTELVFIGKLVASHLIVSKGSLCL